MVKKGSELINDLNNLSGIAIGLCYFMFALIIIYDEIMRYVFVNPTIWGVRVMEYSLGACAFLGSGFALKEKAHVKVGIIQEHANKGTRRVLEAISCGFSLFYMAGFVYLTYVFWAEAFSAREKSGGLFSVSLAIPYFFFLLGMVWLLITKLYLIFKNGEID